MDAVRGTTLGCLLGVLVWTGIIAGAMSIVDYYEAQDSILAECKAGAVEVGESYPIDCGCYVACVEDDEDPDNCIGLCD